MADADVGTAACRQRLPLCSQSLWMVTGGHEKEEDMLCVEMKSEMRKLRQRDLQPAAQVGLDVKLQPTLECSAFAVAAANCSAVLSAQSRHDSQACGHRYLRAAPGQMRRLMKPTGQQRLPAGGLASCTQLGEVHSNTWVVPSDPWNVGQEQCDL